MAKKLPRIQRKALYESDVVKACRDRMQMKVQECTRNRNVVKLRLQEIEEELLRNADNGEEEAVLQRMLDDRAFALKELSFCDGMITVFCALRNVLSDLCVEIQALQQLGWYRYITHVVPNSLPKMLQSENQRDLQYVMELTSNVLQRIEDKIAATVQDKAEFERMMQRIRDIAAEQKSAYTATKSNEKLKTKTVLDEIRAKHQVGAMPLPMQAVQEENRENQKMQTNNY